MAPLIINSPPKYKRNLSRAAVLFGPDVVARSLQTPEGYARVPVRKHLAPRPGQKSLAANVVVFMKWGTKARRQVGKPALHAKNLTPSKTSGESPMKKLFKLAGLISFAMTCHAGLFAVGPD